MEAKTPQELAKMLIDAGIATPETIVACSDEEIAGIEKHFSIKLPSSYKEFLRTMGKATGDWANDVIMTYPGLVKFCRTRAERYAAEKNFDLLPFHFVYLIRDDVFMFFDTREQDPPVYRLDIVADEAPLLVGKSFLEYLTSYINDDIELGVQMKEMRESRSGSAG